MEVVNKIVSNLNKYHKDIDLSLNNHELYNLLCDANFFLQRIVREKEEYNKEEIFLNYSTTDYHLKFIHTDNQISLIGLIKKKVVLNINLDRVTETFDSIILVKLAPFIYTNYQIHTSYLAISLQNKIMKLSEIKKSNQDRLSFNHKENSNIYNGQYSEEALFILRDSIIDFSLRHKRKDIFLKMHSPNWKEHLIDISERKELVSV